ncbi:MAG: nitroreductase family protein [Solobacterium sp.]|nr:nitroreductase family protein [Solobacterium sp.]
MNEVLTQLHERKSVRVFEDRPIEEEAVETILNAAIQAPSAGNQQLYSIIRVKDREKAVQLSESCDHQAFIADARLILVFCADCKKWYDAFRYEGCEPRKPGAGDLLLAVEDALIAAQNAVVAAESLGIGSCYIGDIMEQIETQREILSLPEYVFPAAMLVFGYPTAQQKERRKPSRPELSHIVMIDGYQEKGEAELEALLSHNCGSQNYHDWLNAFCKRKYNSDFAKEMTRSVEEALKQFR